jgi:protein-tyrosine phosphatase
MIDLHCHVLPGIDDGPASMEGSLALARAARGADVQTIVATPHVSWEHRNDAATIAAALEKTRAALAVASIDVQLRAGAEVALTRAAEMEPVELSALGLGGSRWLLMECPFTSATTGFDSALFGLQNRGARIVLAHPERCPAFHHDREMLDTLVDAGMLTSLTAGSLVGRFGRTVQRFARQLVADGLVHNVTSDAHDHTRRPPGIARELEQSGLSSLQAWLTEEVPSAILEDREDIPSPPTRVASGAARQRSGWWRRR